MKELILQALSRFLYKLRGLFVEKTELKKYAKKPKKRYIVGRAMALHPMAGDRYFFQTGMVKMRVDKAFVQALAANPQIGMNYIAISGNDSNLGHSLQELLAEADAYEQKQASKRNPKKWKGVMVIYKTRATIKRTLAVAYKDGCSIDTLTEAVRNGSGELEDIVGGQVIMKDAENLTAETTCKDLHIKAGRVTCTKFSGIQDGEHIDNLFREKMKIIADGEMGIWADRNGMIIRGTTKYKYDRDIQGEHQSHRIRKIRRVQTMSDKRVRKVFVTPICRGRKGIPEYFLLIQNTLKKKSAS